MVSSFHAKTRMARGVGKSLKDDRISELSDDILVYILSLLTMKEAGRTSVLSKTWRHVWAYVPVLNFDGRNIYHHRYLRWVDRVVDSHMAPCIDEFRIKCDLEESNRENIDNWVRFAAEKRVKRLELDFESIELLNHRPRYTFPSFSFRNSLTALQLNSVNVTGEVLERLMYNCKSLELLSVIGSDSLVDLKVVGPSLNLKSLIIQNCCKLENLEISSPNIVSFDYLGTLCLPFKNTPKLTELSVGGLYLCDHLDLLSFISHQIEVLKLYRPLDVKCIANVFPICTRLKILDVILLPEVDEDLFDLGFLIKACPLLHKLVVQLLHLFNLERWGRELRIKGEACPHNHLKIVEIVGFAPAAFGFVEYLIKIAVSLEKMIIAPYLNDETITRARRKAEELRTHLKPGTELQIE